MDGPNVYGYVNGRPLDSIDFFGDDGLKFSKEIVSATRPYNGTEVNVTITYEGKDCCCDKVKLMQMAKSVGWNENWNRNHADQSTWHLDGGAWYPNQNSVSDCGAIMYDNPKMPYWSGGGYQHFIVVAYCIVDEFPVRRLDSLLWHAYTSWSDRFTTYTDAWPGW